MDKSRVEAGYYSITSIDKVVLAGTRLPRTIPIACRMSWVVKRNTTGVKIKRIAYLEFRQQYAHAL